MPIFKGKMEKTQKASASWKKWILKSSLPIEHIVAAILSKKGVRSAFDF
jgi:hypothetical protein